MKIGYVRTELSAGAPALVEAEKYSCKTRDGKKEQNEMKECMAFLDRLQNDFSYRNIFSIMCSHGNAIAAEADMEDGIIRISYAQYEKRVTAAAGALADLLPKQQGAYIGIKLENSPDWPTVFWAILMAGYCPILLDAKAEEPVTLHLLEQAGAVAIVTEEQGGYEGYRIISPAELLVKEAKAGFVPAWADQIALCTSGTTGTARVYVYEGSAMGHQIINAKYFLGSNEDIMYDASEGPLKNLAFLPLHHIFGFVAVYLWFSFFGKTIVYLKDRNPKTIMETCRKLEVTHIFCVPMFWNSVAQGIARKVKQGGEKQEKLFARMSKLSFSLQSNMKRAGRKMVGASIFKGVQGNLVGSSIRFLISGGGHILPESMRTINTIGYPLYNGFGMTETGVTSVELSNDIETRLRSSVGVPFQSIEYRIQPLEGESGVGELFISGQSLHSGKMVDGKYIRRDPEKDKWFATGDIARIEDGRLYIEGRLKEVIINESGENVYPDELEDYFISLPGVDQFCISGINTGSPYEEITMILQLAEEPSPEQIVDLAEHINEINAVLPMYKQVRRVLVSNQPLPVANGIKVQRQKLKGLIEKGQWSCRMLDLTLQKLVGNADEEENANTAGVGDPRFSELKEEVRKIFAEILILDASEIGDFDHFITDLGGDSLSVIGVIAQLEEKYNLFIPDTEFSKAVNVQETALLLYEKLYGEQLQKKAPAPAATGARVTKFEDTKEYQEMQKRFESAMDEAHNPYFVAHDSVIRDTSMVGGKQVINLGSYNYLGMSGNPETVQAAVDAVQKYGTSASGSRTLAGEKTLYQQLEAAIAKWKHTEDAVVLTGGYATNLTFIGNFCGKGDLILYDALSHNSIVQGCQLSEAESKVFPHNDIRALESILGTVKNQYTKVLLVVEGVYSMDGDIAPIPEFVRLKKQYGCFLMVDEAHSSGVIGPNGGGVDDYFGLAPDDIDIKMGTLSKALGTCGGYLAGKKSLITYLKYSLPGFVFTAGISPPLAAACMKAVELIQQHPEIVAALHSNIAFFVSYLKEKGINTCLAKESAIVPVLIGEDNAAFEISYELLQQGIFVPPAVFPAVAKGQSRLRFSISAVHTKEQLKKAADAVEQALKAHGLLS